MNVWRNVCQRMLMLAVCERFILSIDQFQMLTSNSKRQLEMCHQCSPHSEHNNGICIVLILFVTHFANRNIQIEYKTLARVCYASHSFAFPSNKFETCFTLSQNMRKECFRNQRKSMQTIINLASFQSAHKCDATNDRRRD